MYQHLLVPVDDSLLSAANVKAAVKLASSLKARLTFFHAAADLGATSGGALLRSIEPRQFAEAVRGETDSVLSKAMVTARHVGVECEGVARTSDRPAEAIVEMACQKECDLIVMASRGARGVSAWLHGSQTERVLKQAPVALLVTRVEANEPLRHSERALGVIQDEHRSLAVVVQAMHQIISVQDGAALLAGADLITLETMLRYLQEFPQRLHHPKEEQYLHPLLRQRVPGCHETLVELEAQHVREAQLVAAVEQALAAARAGAKGAPDALVAAMQALVKAVWEHIGFEERVILPMAAQHLDENDWKGVADAFANNHDPNFGDIPTEEFRRIFARVATLAAASTARAGAPALR